MGGLDRSTMIAPEPNFDLLESDEVFVEGMLASDVGALWRRLSRLDEVRTVARSLNSDPERIVALCDYVQELLAEPTEPRCRHPHDVAICAALVILQPSPLSAVRHLFNHLRQVEEPSLAWIRRLAQYCDQRAVESVWTVTTLSTMDCRESGTVFYQDESAVTWEDECLRQQRYTLPLAC